MDLVCDHLALVWEANDEAPRSARYFEQRLGRLRSYGIMLRSWGLSAADEAIVSRAVVAARNATVIPPARDRLHLTDEASRVLVRHVARAGAPLSEVSVVTAALLGRQVGQRSHAIVALRSGEVDVEPGGSAIRLHLVADKTLLNRVMRVEARGESEADVCGVRALVRWLGREEVRTGQEGARVAQGDEPIFPHCESKSGKLTWDRASSQRQFARRLSLLAQDAGLPEAHLYKGHSLRRGAITAAALSGVPRREAMRLAGHRSERAHERYIMSSVRDQEVRAAILEKAPWARGTSEAASLLRDKSLQAADLGGGTSAGARGASAGAAARGVKRSRASSEESELPNRSRTGMVSGGERLRSPRVVAQRSEALLANVASVRYVYRGPAGSPRVSPLREQQVGGRLVRGAALKARAISLHGERLTPRALKRAARALVFEETEPVSGGGLP